MKWNPFSVETWIAWLGATSVAAVSATIFFYMNFETRDSFADYKANQISIQDDIIKRLDRMEDKIDRILTIKR